MRRAAYVAEDLISCDKLYILIYNYVYLITGSCQNNVRDVGVAGSNPVTPTIDFIRYFSASMPSGSGKLPARCQFRPLEGQPAVHLDDLSLVLALSLEVHVWLGIYT
jgi:hypothetical protein